MNWKKFFIAFIVILVVYEALGALIHIAILGSQYQALPDLWRPEAEMNSKMWIMYIIDILFVFFFVFIFTKGYAGKGLMEGVRFGLLMWALVVIPGNYAQYVIYPLPYNLVLYWVLFGLVSMVINGILVSAIYKPLEAGK